MEKNIRYIISVALIIAGLVVTLIPRIPYFFRGVNDEVVISIIGLSVAYSGLCLILLMKLKERRLKAVKKGKQIFLIYPAQEKSKARQITHKLHELGFEIWFDENSILPGQIVEKQVNEAIDNSAVAILLLSNEDMGLYMKKEVDGFLRKASVKDESYVPIIPVVIGDAELPAALKNIKSVNYDDEKLIDKLNLSLKSILG
ncbi:toll/interleukin-1 receptor domain-containing protein [Enterobacter sp. BNK-8]|uniref:toll/interleukin-1 receptor domain-containing protein n=1 Tax=Enterobacter sp. BNK-8 TaxID=3376145 RepID=UPI003B5099EF